MSRTKKLILLLCFSCLMNKSYSQSEIRTVIPLSPNAAAIAKYGETPVSYFTGVPNINIPLYSIQGKELKLPISLSYHAGGNKMEDYASWVGLGWTLGEIPCISRNVQGFPDDDAGGFFNLYSGKTIKQLYDSQYVSGWVSLYSTFLDDVRNGDVDPEPDIFSYSLINKSGKFYYNQTTQQFHTIPFDNVKISIITNGFQMVSDDGTIYVFNVKEWTYKPTILLQAVNTWWLSKIVNANHTDSITFAYTMITESFTNTASVTKNTHLVGYATCDDPPGYEISQPGTEIYSIKPDTIKFSSGYIKFKPKTTTRSDLSGSKALDKIEIYNYNNDLIKKFNFRYVYASGWNHLLLDSLWEEGPTGAALSPHKFSYNTGISSPYAGAPLDYWGYYNGANTNTDLIPSILYQFPGYGYKSKLPGADRVTHPDFVQFLILNNITYPTGGTTDYEYECHVVADTTLPLQTTNSSAVVSGNGTGQGTSAHYEQRFTINVPPNAFINDNQGGVYADVYLANLGCDLSQGANLCAVLKITDTLDNPVSMVFTEDIKGMYIANGYYKLMADFYQDPPAYEDFYFGLVWQDIDYAYLGKRFVGGLRVKKITDYDGVDHSHDIIRTYSYTSDTSDYVSSGSTFGLPIFNFTETYFYKEWKDIPFLGCDVNCTVQLLRRTSYSTFTSVSHSGSFVGYKKVDVYYGADSSNGKSTYRFSNEIDIGSPSFPYPPSISREQRRGLLLESVDYKKSGNSFLPVRRINNSYMLYSTYYVVPSINNSLTGALKIACLDVINDPCNIVPERPEQIIAYYEVQSDWMGLASTSEKTYSTNDTTTYVVTSTSYEYDTTHLQIKEILSYASNGDSLVTLPKYPYDLSLAGTAEIARLELINQNRIKDPLQLTKKVNSSQKQLVQTNFKEFFSGKIAPHNVEIQTESNSKEERVQFNKYDVYGHLREQQKANDIKQSYIYDYLNNYPIAEIINADSSSVAYTSFEADGKGGWTYNGSTSGSYYMTGLKSYDMGGGNITKSGLTNATYIVSYWGKTGSVNVNSVGPTRIGKTVGAWTYYEHEVTGTSITVSGSYFIDELRLYPKVAMMTSYTYTPLIGMTSQSDQNGHIVYYEYDNLYRLKLIKDEDGKILKRMDYKYKGTRTD